MKTGLYVHFPFCERKCYYCDFYSGNFSHELRSKYLDELVKEIAFVGADKKKRIDTVYFGGGTPGLLSNTELEKVIDAIYKNFDLANLEEFTIEVNPTFNVDFNFYRSSGINRLSVGIQSLDDGILKKIGRLHNAKQAKKFLESASKFFDNISADLIIGIDDNQQIENDARYLFDRVKHISGYMLSLENGTLLKKAVENNSVSVATEESAINQYEHFCNACEEVGLFRYEVSNFAFPTYESKHNSIYWSLNSYYGLGAGAHSYIDGRRYYNEPDLQKYISGINYINGLEIIEREFSEAAEKEEFIMLSLRTVRGLDLVEYKNRFHTDFLKEFSTKLEKVREYIEIKNEHCSIRKEYFLVQNSIIAEII